jgi:aminoglycoside phosphotransferase (APT) family kinase protein
VVAKLFHPRYAYAVQMELERARAVESLGAPCPAVVGLVEHEGRSGIAFERVDGPLLLEDMREGGAAIARVAEPLAELHTKIHSLRVPDESPLPKLRNSLARFVSSLPEPERARAERELAHVPHDTGLCHMDLHPGNVIVSGGRLVVVDWVNACSGALSFDAGRSVTLLAYQSAEKRDGRRQAARLELAASYRAHISAKARFAPGELEQALGFASAALLREQPDNPFAPELRAAIPWLT